MPHYSTFAVVAALGSLAVGCANNTQQGGAPASTTQPTAASAALAQRPAPRPSPTPAPARPAQPPPPAPAPAPAATPAPAPTTGRTYTIKPGDSLWKISKEVYGDATKYEQIQKANPTLDPQLLKPGTVIVIP